MSNMTNTATVNTVRNNTNDSKPNYMRRRVIAVFALGLLAGGAIGIPVGTAIATPDRECTVTSAADGIWDGGRKVSNGGETVTDCGTFKADAFHDVGETVTVTKPIIGFSHIK